METERDRWAKERSSDALSQHAASEPWQHGEVELVKPRAATINVESLGR